MTTPPSFDVRRELRDAVDNLADNVSRSDGIAWRVISAARLLELQLAGESDPIFADPSTADPPGASVR